MQAYFLGYHRFRERGKALRPVVRVLSIHRKTAHIEARRYNGQIVRRYVKLSRLQFVKDDPR